MKNRFDFDKQIEVYEELMENRKIKIAVYVLAGVACFFVAGKLLKVIGHTIEDFKSFNNSLKS